METLKEFMERELNTQLQAYKKHIESGMALNQSQSVFKTLSFFPDSSDRDLSERLSIAKTSVIARRNNLMKSGFVVVSGTKRDKKTGMRVRTYRVK